MAWTFCNIRLKKFPTMATEWVLRIDQTPQLWEHELATGKSKAELAFHDEIKVTNRESHYVNMTAMVAHTRAECRGTSWVKAYGDMVAEVSSNQMKLLAEGNILYLKASGGYSYDSPNRDFYDVLETKESEELIYPQMAVRYIQWPNGNHWYAKAGERDIEWDGKQKWDTREAAEKAVKAWKKSVGGWTDADRTEEREKYIAKHQESKK